MFVALREVHVPWRIYAHFLLRSGLSGCLVNHADLMVNGSVVPDVWHRSEVYEQLISLIVRQKNKLGRWLLCTRQHFGMRGRTARWLHQQHDVLKLVPMNNLMERYIREGWIRNVHGIVYQPSHMNWCLGERNRVPMIGLSMGCSVLRFQLTEPQFHKAARTLGTFAVLRWKVQKVVVCCPLLKVAPIPG